jgi:hypothetical protein
MRLLGFSKPLGSLWRVLVELFGKRNPPKAPGPESIQLPHQPSRRPREGLFPMF